MSVFIRTVQPGLSSQRKTHDITQVEGALVRGKLKKDTRLLLEVRQPNGDIISCHYSNRDSEDVLGCFFTLHLNDWLVLRGYFTGKNNLHCDQVSVRLPEDEIERRQIEAARKVEAYEIQEIRDRLA
jgi:hypothetical protein